MTKTTNMNIVRSNCCVVAETVFMYAKVDSLCVYSVTEFSERVFCINILRCAGIGCIAEEY
jgi:hypothetical protein